MYHLELISQIHYLSHMNYNLEKNLFWPFFILIRHICIKCFLHSTDHKPASCSLLQIFFLLIYVMEFE